MKSRIYLICIFVVVSIYSCVDENRNETLNDSVFIISQSELDAFTNNNYKIINGNLEISSTDIDPVTSLHGLHNLQEVNGNIIVKFTNIESLNGLHNLKKVTNLNIHNNSNLLSFDLLDQLDSGLERIAIYENDNLTTIDISLPFDALTSISIRDNPELTTVLNENELSIVQGELEIKNNNSLTAINGFNNLTAVNGILSIEGNNSLNTITMDQLSYANRFNLRSASLENASFLNLETINITFDLWETQLQNLEGFSNITSLGGRFTIIQNSTLNDWCSMSDLILGENFNFGAQYFITSNGYNPSPQDWEIGACSI